MRKHSMAGLMLTLALLPAVAGYARTYETTFALAENPISEGGNWVNGGSDGLDWTDVATMPGLAYGLETGSAGYDDATALVGGAWGPNDSNYYSLPLGRMAKTEAPPHQERRPRRTDGRGERRTVVAGNRRVRETS